MQTVSHVAIVSLMLAGSLQGAVFTKIASTNDVIPHGIGRFTSVNNPQITSNHVVFSGQGTNSQQGVYRWNNGTITRAVDGLMTDPDSGSEFGTINDSRVSDFGSIIFGATTLTGPKGLYRSDSSGTLSRIVDTTVQGPGEEAPFTNVLSGHEIGADQFCFVGTTSEGFKIYTRNGSPISLIMEPGQALPGTTATHTFTHTVVGNDGQLAFWSSRSDGKTAIYCYSSNQLHLIADTNTLAPAQVANFTGFSDPPWIDNGKVVFHGSYPGGTGLYSANADGSGLTMLVDRMSTVPGTATNTFNTFNAGWGYSNNRLLFWSSYNTPEGTKNGLYLVDGGALSKVIDINDLLDGQNPTGFGITRQSINASGKIAFTATFASAGTAVYTTMDGGGVTPGTFTLTALANPAHGGVVMANPSAASYASNSAVTLTATANVGFRFSHWVGLKTALNPAIVTIRTNRTVTAVFTNVPTYSLTMNVLPPGAGTVTPNPATVSNLYSSGTMVNISAQPTGTNQFSAWVGVSSLSNQINVQMSGNKTVTALFNNPGQFVIYNTNGKSAVMFMQNTQRLGSVMLNNGQALAPRWRLVGAGDFNGNGSKDILLWSTNGQVAIWMMNGNIRVETSLSKPVGLAWRVGGVADFNADGKVDVLWHNPANGKLMAWQNNTTTNPVTIVMTNKVALGWRVAATANFGGDNSPDLVLQNTDGRVAFWVMNGYVRSGTAIAPRGTVTAGTGFQVMGATDLDGDGHTDIIFQRSDGTLKVWYFTGMTFNSEVTLPNKVAPGWKLRVVK